MAKHGLGRGLDSLIKSGTAPRSDTSPSADPDSGVIPLPVSQITKSPYQPRQTFEEDALEELSLSIRTHGVLQPLLVRKKGDGYELVAGERRLRAAGVAGLTEVPAILIDASDSDAMQIALIENLQREDLNIVEEAQGYRALADTFGLTQEQVAERVGKSRAGVANALRLLDLPDPVLELLRDNRLTAGHAKVILALDRQTDRLELARRTVEEGLSVRQLERLVKRRTANPPQRRSAKSDLPASYLASICDQLHAHFGTSVRVTPTRTFANGKKSKGTIEVDFFTNDDLDRLLEILGIELD